MGLEPGEEFALDLMDLVAIEVVDIFFRVLVVAPHIDFDGAPLNKAEVADEVGGFVTIPFLGAGDGEVN